MTTIHRVYVGKNNILLMQVFNISLFPFSDKRKYYFYCKIFEKYLYFCRDFLNETTLLINSTTSKY